MKKLLSASRTTVQQKPERTMESAAVTVYKGYGLQLELEVVTTGELAKRGGL